MSSSNTSNHTTMDLLSALFFLVAGIWLLAAIAYSLMVLYFLRLRSQDMLHTIYTDETFGRWYIFGCFDQHRPSNERYYIPFGCIFRRYARHLNIDVANDPYNGESRDGRSPHQYTRAERRQALIVILMDQKERRPSKIKKEGQSPSASSTANSSIDNKQSRSVFQRFRLFRNSDHGNSNAVVDITEMKNDEKNNVSDVENGIIPSSSHENCNCSIDSTPVCSICLGPYDDDDNVEENDDNNINKSNDPTVERTTTNATGIFQSPTCVHIFHRECILSWLQQRRSNSAECPCCRTSMVNEKDVWKTIQYIRKQEKKNKLRRDKLNNNNRKQSKPSTRTTTANHEVIDETQNGESEHE